MSLLFYLCSNAERAIGLWNHEDLLFLYQLVDSLLQIRGRCHLLKFKWKINTFGIFKNNISGQILLTQTAKNNSKTKSKNDHTSFLLSQIVKVFLILFARAEPAAAHRAEEARSRIFNRSGWLWPSPRRWRWRRGSWRQCRWLLYCQRRRSWRRNWSDI